MFLRVAGTINTKTKYDDVIDYNDLDIEILNDILYQKIVRIDKCWNFEDISNIPDFITLYSNNTLIQEYISQVLHRIWKAKVKMLEIQNSNGGKPVLAKSLEKYYMYVHKLIYNSGIRKIALSLVIVPYLVVILKLQSDLEIEQICNSWLERCNQYSRLRDNQEVYNQRIQTAIETSRISQIPPASINKLKENYPDIYIGINYNCSCQAKN